MLRSQAQFWFKIGPQNGPKFGEAIANFHHKGGFRDDGRDQASSSRAPVRAPFQQIQHPKEVDLRKFTLDAKSLKRTLFIQNKRKDSNDDPGEVSKENKKIRLDKTEEDLNQKEVTDDYFLGKFS